VLGNVAGKSVGSPVGELVRVLGDGIGELGARVRE